MKKASVAKNSKKLQSVKKLNMKLHPEDQEKNKSSGYSDAECMLESQRLQLQESSKHQPSMVAEGERMIKKISDLHSENKNLKIEVKRKQTTVDLLRSERDRVQRSVEELEEKFREEKCKILEDLITLQKDRDFLQDANVKAEALLEEGKQQFRTLQEDFDNLQVKLQQIERERLHDKEIIDSLLECKEKFQKDLLEARMTIEAKSALSNDEATKEFQSKIEQLYEEIETLKRTRDHEHLLRERLSQDNLDLIKRHSELEAEMAANKAHLREEQSRLSALEQVHLNTILESSEAKSRDMSLKEEIEGLKNLLKNEQERTYNLSHQVSDEQRFKSREEEKFNNLQQRFDQREENMKVLKNENIALSRDNTYLKDQVIHVKQQIQAKDSEVVNLKHKVQEMQISVEEFIQTNQAATRLAGERRKQLSQLAQNMQALACIDDQN
ncbi:hypothetical protein JTE90_028261 [Oedothorax gibbosus]|uniref:Uncharacterized protein n=1 Tax=Oedothorax gibbosus TaxID=931172 RepID=A0AAV6UB28_9ARAC|nr:hypothetical protein JTE90_028261 [Oedothorax gibbosus]